jgi:hypothetical protein
MEGADEFRLLLSFFSKEVPSIALLREVDRFLDRGEMGGPPTADGAVPSRSPLVCDMIICNNLSSALLSFAGDSCLKDDALAARVFRICSLRLILE